MIVSSLNVNGLRSPVKLDQLKNLLKQKQIPVLFLQETHFDDVFCQNLVFENYSVFWSHGSNFSRGVGILVSKIFGTASFSHSDQNGRLLVVNLKFNSSNLKLINIYAPNSPGERNHFFKELDLFTVGQNIVLGGDFNCVLNNTLDRDNSLPYRTGHSSSSVSKELKKLSFDFDLVDPYRSLYPTRSTFTWFSASAAARLDRFYISSSLVVSVKSVKHSPISFSDHSMVSLNFGDIFVPPHGRGFWKCNTSVIKDSNLYFDFSLLWKILDLELIKSPEWWDSCKNSFRLCFQDFSQKVKIDRDKEIKESEALLSSLISLNPVANFEQIQMLKSKISSLQATIFEGAMVRSRATAFDQDEKCSRYFLKVEERNIALSSIDCLETADGTLSSDPDVILQTCTDFYKNLLSAEPIDYDLFDYFLVDLPSLSTEDSLSCDGPLTEEEIWEALSQMSNNKTPGCDGLPKEFYVQYWHLIKNSFILMVNNCLDSGQLSGSQRLAILKLLCKLLEQKYRLKNWRPISLLNVDYKIISKCLTNRLKRVIHKIVEVDQTASVPGRTIHDNIHLIRNITDYCNERNIGAAFLCLDQEKAFDRVNHDFLFAVLQAFGFGNDFINKIKCLYNNISARVLVNNFLGPIFQVTRSVRQGCSLSPLLYILIMEPFAHKIREHQQIIGLPVPASNVQAKISQFADDTTLIVTNFKSFRFIFMLLELFCAASGGRINWLKTFGIWLGPWRTKTDKPFPDKPIIFRSAPSRFLGVYVDSSGPVNSNWLTVSQKFRSVLNLWAGRDLTLRGRAVICNSLACAKMWYLAAVWPAPKEIIKTMTSTLFNFIWFGKKYEPIKRSTLYCLPTKGGLGITNIQLKLDVLALKHLAAYLNNSNSKWKNFADYWLSFHFRDFQAFNNSAPHSILHQPPFYKYLLEKYQFYSDIVPNLNDFLKNFNTKVMYNLFLDYFSEPPRILDLYPNIDYRQVWKSNLNPFLDPYLRNFNFKFNHNIIPVYAYLHRCHIISTFPPCGICRMHPETLSHLFFECPIIQQLIRLLESAVSSVGNTTFNLDRDVALFSLFNRQYGRELSNFALLLITLLKYSIWCARCAAVFDRAHISSEYIYALFKSKLVARIRLDYIRLEHDQFLLLWCKTGLFCSVINNKLSIHF